MIRLAGLVAAAVLLAPGARAQTFETLQAEATQRLGQAGQGAVQMFGSASQYASQAWRNLFPEKVEICVAYGTEKETWLKQMVEKFSKNPANKNLTIKLVPVGSVSGAEAIEQHGGRVGTGGAGCVMTAWSPASSAFRDFALQRTFRAMSLAGVQPAGIASANDLVAAQAPSLVRIPLVLTLWNDAYTRIVEAARKADPAVTDEKIFSFEGLIRAQQASYPNGAYTTIYTTDPGESNSGFSTLLLMAYEFTPVGRSGVDPASLNSRNADFWNKVRSFYTSTDGKSLNNFKSPSTGTLFRDQFLLNGPAGDVSGVMTYENLAIQYADAARKQHQQAYRVIYPLRNVMSDNPYYVLNATYDTATKKTVMVPEKEKKAAIAFMQFLVEPEQQRDAVALGFRPGNLGAGIDLSAAGSPFVKEKEIGVQVSPPNVRFLSTGTIGEPVINNLLTGWKALMSSLR